MSGSMDDVAAGREPAADRTRPPRRAWWLVVAVVGLVLAIGLVLSRPSGAPEDAGPLAAWQGRPAPELTIVTVDGKTLRLSEQRGRRVILDFWATWCPPCLQEIPHLQRLARETPEAQLLVVGISAEGPATLRQFAEQHGIGYPIGTCPELPPPFAAITSIPTTVVIDRTGIIRRVGVGYHSYEELKAMASAAGP